MHDGCARSMGPLRIVGEWTRNELKDNFLFDILYLAFSIGHIYIYII